MKKLLAAMMCLALLVTISCLQTPRTDKPKPAWVQHMLDNTHDIAIIDWRTDGKTAWVWVDNLYMDKPCDYVVVVEIIDLDNNEYGGLYIINETNMPEDVDACESAYEIYDNYCEGMKEMETRTGSSI